MTIKQNDARMAAKQYAPTCGSLTAAYCANTASQQPTRRMCRAGTTTHFPTAEVTHHRILRTAQTDGPQAIGKQVFHPHRWASVEIRKWNKQTDRHTACSITLCPLQ